MHFIPTIVFVAIIFSYCGEVHANEKIKIGQELSAQDATVSILRMLVNADILPVEIREVLVAALSQDSVTKDFEAWKSVLLEKLNDLDDDEHGYKHHIITIINQSLQYTTLLHPIENLLSMMKVPGTEFTGVDVFQAFNLVGGFVKLINDKQNPSYTLKPISTMAMLSPGDCIAMKMWIGWWTFMIVTNNDHSGEIQVVCYVATNSSDCVQSEFEFFLGFQKSLSLQEVTLKTENIQEVYLVHYLSSISTLLPSETVKRAKSSIGDAVQGWNQIFSHTSEHFASWAKTGQEMSYQLEEIRWQLKKQVFNAKIRHVFSIWFGERVFLDLVGHGAEGLKSIVGAVIMEGAQTTEEHLSKEAVKQGAKYAGKEAVKTGVKNAGKETFKQGVKQAGKQTFKQGAKQAGKKAFKEGAKQVGKQAFKHGAKQAGKEVFKHGAKQAGKESFKHGAKQAGKEAFKEGARQVGKEAIKQGAKQARTEAFKQGAKQAGKESFKHGAKLAGKEAFKQGAKQAGKESFKHGAKQAGKEAIKQGAKQAGKEAFKQGAKQAGKEAFKHGAKQVGKEAFKHGAKQAGKQAFKHGVKQAGKEAFKQGAKQAGKQAFKHGVKQAGKEVLKHGAKQAGKEAFKHGAKQAGKEAFKHGAKQAGKEVFKQGAKQAGKEVFKHGAKQAGKEAFKHGTKQAGKEVFKHGAKQAGKQVFKQGAKQTGKQAFKQGAKQTAKEGVKYGGRVVLGATVVVELASLGYDLHSDYQLYASGEISRKEFCKRAASSSVGSVGSVGGATAGAALGSFVLPIPGVGTFLGAVVGGVTGYFGGKAFGSMVGEKLKYFCEGDEELSEDSISYGTFENSDETMIVKDLESEEDAFCHHDCDQEYQSERDKVFEDNDIIITNQAYAGDSEMATDDVNESDTDGDIEFYFHSNDSESGEEMKGILFPIFGNIQTVCWEEGDFCYCTVASY